MMDLSVSCSPAYTVSVMATMAVVPYVRQTRRTRWRRDRWGTAARRYNEFKGQLRDALVAVMNLRGVTMLTGPVGFECEVGLANAGRCDVDNAIKALLDSIQGALIDDDRQVWELGVSRKHKDSADWFWMRVWNLERES